MWITHCLPVALNSTYSWAEDVSQALATIANCSLINLYGAANNVATICDKAFDGETFAIGMIVYRKMFVVEASCSLWLVNHSSQNIFSRVKNHKNHESFPLESFAV